jgi:hypothetical protein
MAAFDETAAYADPLVLSLTYRHCNPALDDRRWMQGLVFPCFRRPVAYEQLQKGPCKAGWQGRQVTYINPSRN